MPYTRPARSIRVLLSEGSSLSAVQTVNDLGPLGYQLHIVDPAPRCLASWSRYVQRVHPCPPYGLDPAGYLHAVEAVIASARIDVLLPTHEQSYLFARVRSRLAERVGLPVPDFAAVDAVLNKASFSRLLHTLGIPQPPTRVVSTADALVATTDFPCFVKTAYGASSRGVWLVHNAGQLRLLAEQLVAGGLLADDAEVIVQAPAAGEFELTLAAFDRGRLVGAHCCRRLRAGASGSSASKVAVDRPAVREHLSRLGAHLGWHGALALDYCYDPATGTPRYFDANPRLVEPMPAAIAGVSLSRLIVHLALGDQLEPAAAAPAGVRTHMLLMALLGIAEHGGGRIASLKELLAALGHRGHYAGSQDELLRPRDDPRTLLPLLLVVGRLLASPSGTARGLRTAASGLSLTRELARRIAALD